MLTVYAPAKLNLVLEVLGECGAYHQISSILQTIDMCDVLDFELAERISFNCNEVELEKDNLVVQAAALLREETGCSKGARIELRKHIPWGMGLGGGSSDAASTLRALNHLWELELSTSELLHLASRLGSDVPFFICGGTALVGGRGEKLKPLSSLRPSLFVLLLPPLTVGPNKTGQLYGRLNAGHFTGGQFVQAAVQSLEETGEIPPSRMFNVFEKVAFDFFPELAGYRTSFEEAGAAKVCLAGSGPGLFAVVSGEAEAGSLCSRLEKQGLSGCRVASLPGK
ncbi:MAG: 4-(cytidine 5'-diphospho)-2-C-methyl-D-erythritol kinase [Chloroflexota bacterium]|nr:4-(cytidine 5'-diphospho)-2-C-methyl-D-erythritol kinase [Chloroflexota bacterium]